MKKIFLMLFFLISTFLFSHEIPSQEKNSLICIHGFLDKGNKMHFFIKNFKRHGWEVFNWNYNGREKYIEEHAQDLVKNLNIYASKKPNRPIYFVAHSMGSLILRCALNDPNCPKEAKMGKVVLIAPPNQGSSLGRTLSQYSLARKIAKEKSGKQLMKETTFDHLGKFPHPKERILVISGNININPWLKKPNDGTVLVEETCLNTPHEHIVLPREHITFVYSKRVFSIVQWFLKK